MSPHAHNGTLNIHQHTLYTHTYTHGGGGGGNRGKEGERMKGGREEGMQEGRRNQKQGHYSVRS